MQFYQSCFGGDLNLIRLGDTPMKAQFPPEKHDRIINAHLKSGAIEISGTDWMASPAFDPVQGNMSAIFVTGASREELQPIFDRLGNARRPDGSTGFFFADRFTFGTPLYRSRLEAAIQSVPGVNGVLAITYRRRGSLAVFVALPVAFLPL